MSDLIEKGIKEIIAGCVAIVAGIIIIVVVCCCIRARKKKQQQNEAQNANNNNNNQEQANTKSLSEGEDPTPNEVDDNDYL